MKVYAYWNSTASAPDDQAEQLRFWEQSWSRHGWTPQLLTIFNAQRSEHYQPSQNVFDQMCFALHSVGGGWMADSLVINNGLRPFRPKFPMAIEPWSLIWMNREAAKCVATNGPNDVVHFEPGLIVRYQPGATAKCVLFNSVQDIIDSELCR